MGISYNRAILVGRLVRDPESSYSSTGTHICKFTIAVDRPVFSSNNAEPGTDFLRIVTFGKTADFVSNYMAKGRLVLVEGRIQVSQWQAQDGSNRYSTDIIADKVNFMETKKTAGESSFGGDRYQNKEEVYSYKNDVITNNDDDDEMFDGPITSDNDEVPF